MKTLIYYVAVFALSIGTVFGFVVNSNNIEDKYSENTIVECTYSANIPAEELAGLSSDRAIISVGTEINSELFSDNTYASLLIDNSTNTCLVAHNAHRRIYPASMTKLVTAMVVCDEINAGRLSLDDVITVKEKVKFNESGVMASSLDGGCKITVRNLMYGLLMKSYNDYAVILAETVSGSVGEFAELMNKKAASIGATNSHFVNPHGLHDDNHYVSAYDMYLIVNECHKYDLINEIDSYKSYTFNYTDSNSVPQSVELTPTNQYLSDKATLPSNISILTWKTGTTSMAGRCLTMIVSINSKEYTIVVCDRVSATDLYSTISTMFNLTQN